MVNPYSCYILGFVFSLAVYQLGWSEVYPQLSASLLIFLVTTIAVSFGLSRWWSKRQIIEETAISKRINPWLVTGFLYLLWIADFIREGGAPLYKIIFGIPYDYKQFGVPSLHVLAVTFGSFYCIYLLHIYLTEHRKKFLLLYVINMSAAILIYSRSMLFFNLASSAFLYLLTLDKIPYKKMALAIPLIIVLFYFFGVVGTKRVSFETNSKYDPGIFLETGRATNQFKNSIIPKEFFWPYIYISSPLANLQVNINTFPVKPISTKLVLEFFNNEILFESISKRINALAGVEREKENTIKEPFNVSTVYSRGYSYLGWIGIVLTALIVLALPVFYLKAIRKNPYRLPALAILCTTYLFLTYDNTIRLMALGFQLVYPFALPLVEDQLSRLKLKS